MSSLGRVVPVDRRALRLYRRNFWKIAAVSAMVFAPLSLLQTLAHHYAEHLVDEHGSRAVIGVMLFAVTALFLFGYALCSGLLDKMVVAPEFGHPEQSLGRALRTLPYRGLVTLDVATTIAIGVGLLFGALPGIVLFTFVSLAPPLMVSEHLGVVAAMRRSASLVRRAFFVTLVVVTVPVLLEHEIFAAVELLTDLPVVLLWLAHVLASMFVLAFVVLSEITLAFTLVDEESPRRDRAPKDIQEEMRAVEDGQPPPSANSRNGRSSSAAASSNA